MKLKLTLLAALTAASAQGATSTALANTAGTAGGLPIVDNTGVPIPSSEASIQIGTFETAFAATLGTLDTLTADQAVIDAFMSAGPAKAFSTRAGLFNGNIPDLDADNSLGNAGAPLYALITWSPAGGAVQALVLSFGDVFPDQDLNGGQGIVDGRTLTVDNALSSVAFGNNQFLVRNVDTSSYPAALQIPGYSQGLTFDAIPEPSTSLLAGLAGLALVARRRR